MTTEHIYNQARQNKEIIILALPYENYEAEFTIRIYMEAWLIGQYILLVCFHEYTMTQKCVDLVVG